MNTLFGITKATELRWPLLNEAGQPAFRNEQAMNNIFTIPESSLGNLLLHLRPKRFQVIASCTGTKSMLAENPLTEADFDKGVEWRQKRELETGVLPAREMYSGRQHLALLEGISTLNPNNVDLKIVSAGYGLISGDTPIAPYDVTFSDRSIAEVEALGRKLKLPEDVKAALETTDCDLTFVLLGKTYLRACGLESPIFAPCPTVFLGTNFESTALRGANLFQVPLTNDDAKRLGAGQVWIKGQAMSQALSALN